jgi:hypothetical protein
MFMGKKKRLSLLWLRLWSLKDHKHPEVIQVRPRPKFKVIVGQHKVKFTARHKVKFTARHKVMVIMDLLKVKVTTVLLKPKVIALLKVREVLVAEGVVRTNHEIVVILVTGEEGGRGVVVDEETPGRNKINIRLMQVFVTSMAKTIGEEI